VSLPPRENIDPDDPLLAELLQECGGDVSVPNPEHVEQLRREIDARTRLPQVVADVRIKDTNSRGPASSSSQHSSSMKANSRDDDLFQDSTMTFGEHLGELRSCLFKAVLSLALGFVFGLAIGRWIVHVIQDPLETALTQHQIRHAVDAHIKQLEDEFKKKGEPLPAEMQDKDAFREKTRKLLFEEQLLSEDCYILPADALAALKQAFPKEFAQVKLPKNFAGNEISRSKMLRFPLWHPAEDDPRLRLETLNVQESLMMYIKASLIAGIVIASPLIFYFLWSFVAAGLYPNERRYVNVFLPFSVALFLAGALLAYFFVFPPVLNFFFGFSDWLGQEQRPRVGEWMNFVLMMPLAFGISFQLPLVMLFLERIGVVTVKSYISKWKMAVVIMAIVALVINPGGDPTSMMLMLVPMIFLYFGGVMLCKWMPAINNPHALERIQR